jgi:two-component system CheB/CheR fusion protein
MDETLQSRIRQLEAENAQLRSEVRNGLAARELYLKIFEDFPALIWRAGLDMKCDYFNRTWLEFTGRTAEQEAGDGWTEGVHPADLDLCVETYVSHFQRHQPFVMVYRLKNRFGEYRWIRDHGRPFYGVQDEFLGYIGSCYDITEEQETTLRLEELNRAKTQFFSLIAHDLRGPVGAIEGLTEILDESCSDLDTNEQKAMMHQLAEASSRTSRLLNDLLTWTKSQLGGTRCEPVTGPLLSVVEEAAEPIRETFHQKNLNLVIAVPADLTVYADLAMTRTVLRNLLSNAGKFSQAGGTVAITASVIDGHTKVTVRDGGIGMTDDQVKELFRVGEKTSRPGTSGETGSGLGLVICREFVEKNGGKIWAESQPDRGTSVTVLWRREAPPRP